MSKFILTEEEKSKIRGMYGLLNESEDGCEDLCEFMYRGNCESIEVGLNSQNATNEWYKQKKVQHPEFFNPERDPRLREKYATTRMMSEDDKATFWITLASAQCQRTISKYKNKK